MRIGEGSGSSGHPEAPKQKDAGLDVVVWRDFPDKRDGKLIAFGQCATGENWTGKLGDLRPRDWCKLWMNESPLVDPLATLFVPRRVDRDFWRRANGYGGILFDRCRVVALTTQLDKIVETRVGAWTAKALKGESTE